MHNIYHIFNGILSPLLIWFIIIIIRIIAGVVANVEGFSKAFPRDMDSKFSFFSFLSISSVEEDSSASKKHFLLSRFPNFQRCNQNPKTRDLIHRRN